MESSTILAHYCFFLQLTSLHSTFFFFMSQLCSSKDNFKIFLLLYDIFHIVTIIFFANICYCFELKGFSFCFTFLRLIVHTNNFHCAKHSKSIALVSLIRCQHILLVKLKWSWEWPPYYLKKLCFLMDSTFSFNFVLTWIMKNMLSYEKVSLRLWRKVVNKPVLMVFLCNQKLF